MIKMWINTIGASRIVMDPDVVRVNQIRSSYQAGLDTSSIEESLGDLEGNVM